MLNLQWMFFNWRSSRAGMVLASIGCMSKGPRYILPDRIYELSCRTFQSQLLLTPSSELNSLVHGVLGRALNRFKVRLHWYVFMSNHYHMLASASRPDELVAFMGYVNSNVAREVNALRGRRGAFWDRRYEPLLLSQEADIQERRLAYLLGQGCKEGLVESPKEWPGASPLNAVLEGTQIMGRWVDRTRMYRDSCSKLGAQAERAYEQAYAVELSPLPAWHGLDDMARRARIDEMVASIEEMTADENARKRRKPAGAAKVCAMDPFTRTNRRWPHTIPPCGILLKFGSRRRKPPRTLLPLRCRGPAVRKASYACSEHRSPRRTRCPSDRTSPRPCSLCWPRSPRRWRRRIRRRRQRNDRVACSRCSCDSGRR